MKLSKIKLHLAIIAACLITLLLLPACTVTKPVLKPDGTVGEVHEVDPRLTQGLAIGSAANAASVPVNPAAPWVELGLLAIAGGASWVAKRKNDKAAANEQLLKVVIQAIDALDDSKVKEAVQTHATRVGVEGDLNTAVKKVGSGAI
jgi:hypothetical protein